MGRSGKFLASNDCLIREFLKDPNFKIESDLKVYTKFGHGKQLTEVWREKKLECKIKNGNAVYWFVKYKDVKLAFHRVIYEKFVGRLESDLTINHKDKNPSNNNPDNLELVTMSKNNNHKNNYKK